MNYVVDQNTMMQLLAAQQQLQAMGPQPKVVQGQMVQDVPMSQGDTVVIHTSQPDAEGFYVDARQRQQDAYAQQVAIMERQKTAQLQHQPSGVVITEEGDGAIARICNDPSSSAVGTPFREMHNPNAKVVITDQRAICSPDGNTVVYL